VGIGAGAPAVVAPSCSAVRLLAGRAGDPLAASCAADPPVGVRDLLGAAVFGRPRTTSTPAGLPAGVYRPPPSPATLLRGTPATTLPTDAVLGADAVLDSVAALGCEGAAVHAGALAVAVGDGTRAVHAADGGAGTAVGAAPVACPRFGGDAAAGAGGAVRSAALDAGGAVRAAAADAGGAARDAAVVARGAVLADASGTGGAERDGAARTGGALRPSSKPPPMRLAAPALSAPPFGGARRCAVPPPRRLRWPVRLPCVGAPGSARRRRCRDHCH